jgi:leucyl aminopeptidase
MTDILLKSSKVATALDLVATAGLDAWLEGLDAAGQSWVRASAFKGASGNMLLVPGTNGTVASAAMGIGGGVDDFWAAGAGSRLLPEGVYQIRSKLTKAQATNAAVAWALGAYAFDRYADKPGGKARLVWPKGVDQTVAAAIIGGITLGRTLINTPANDMGPEELADAARALARQHKAKIKVIIGDDLLKQNFPTIHAVGRASPRAPRLIDLTWGPAKGAPKVTLIGKGVCFDTGGLDLKSAGGMLNMKKDMGGAANVLAAANMIMGAGLPVRLRVLIPAVENSVSGNAMRPLDVIKTRKGITVEVGNTDAEGRLVLCDAIALAMEEKPDMVIDCATLTGAARVALGPSLPALFSNDDALANDILKAGLAVEDPLWHLPLHQPYVQMLNSDVADLNNVSSGGFAGAITAALYLHAFAEDAAPWAHIDMMGWNPTSAPGRPKGGEAQSARAIFEMLSRRYG